MLVAVYKWILSHARCKRKSVIYPAVIYAFALTARNYPTRNNPGCRYALPWAMCFCAYSATITYMNFRIRIFNF